MPNKQEKKQQKATLTPAKLNALERADKFIEGLKEGKSVVQLAKELEVDRATLYRDFDEWLKTSGPAELYCEWLRDCASLKEANPEKVLDCKTRLLCKVFEKQSKVELNVTSQTAITISTDLTAKLAEYNKIISDSTATVRVETGNLPKNDSAEQVH